MAIKYINIFQSKAPKIFPQIGSFGLKINHLATVVWRRISIAKTLFKLDSESIVEAKNHHCDQAIDCTL
jgi:hypothetical protein